MRSVTHAKPIFIKNILQFEYPKNYQYLIKYMEKLNKEAMDKVMIINVIIIALIMLNSGLYKTVLYITLLTK